jgi:hypothetical protein
MDKNEQIVTRFTHVCTENLIRVDDVMESPKLAPTGRATATSNASSSFFAVGDDIPPPIASIERTSADMMSA